MIRTGVRCTLGVGSRRQNVRFCCNRLSAASAWCSAVVPAPIEQVWAKARQFDVPDIKASDMIADITLDQSATAVGCLRTIALPGVDGAPGPKVYETLVALDDDEKYVKYRIMPYGDKYPEGESPFPGKVIDYNAKMQCTPVTATNETFITWGAQWKSDKPAETEAMVNGIFTALISAISAANAQK
eukprot:TRINITY_DN104741_c0_g1_i1.p1 TRINITY_DN104741_c0_g1~~TRINITY_DN104741_c0_g1_i1.p1  ORF type:complete len:186 (+),score=12.92 TRINITY_DN104741_c0_g1_i1:36-593(+)